MRTTGAARTIRPKGRGTASASWLPVLVGLSCTYSVGLPGAAVDAGGSPAGTGGVQGLDASVDQSGAGDRQRSYPLDGCAYPQYLRVLSNTVEMIVALDRSTSMQQHVFDSTTRLQAAQDAIVAATGNHPGIWFGLELFPSSTDCNGASCCAGSVSVQPTFNQSTSIETQMACGSGDAGCPTAGDDSPSPSALQQCREYFVAEGSQGGRSSQFVLLMTDQDPTCAADSFADGTPCTSGTNEAGKLGARNVGVQNLRRRAQRRRTGDHLPGRNGSRQRVQFRRQLAVFLGDGSAGAAERTRNHHDRGGGEPVPVFLGAPGRQSLSGGCRGQRHARATQSHRPAGMDIFRRDLKRGGAFRGRL